MGKVLAVCISEKKGTQKKNVGSVVFVEDWGLEGDAHAGKWHRQVSLLSSEKINAFRAKGAEVEDGAFGENLVVEGIDFAKLPVGTRFRCGEVVLELTQIGKECHNGCAIFQKMGECIMPREGVFTRVLKGGKVSVGDEMTVDKAMIFDTHAHYDDEAFDEDRFEMLESMQENGIGHIVDVCASVGHFDRVYDLVEKSVDIATWKKLWQWVRSAWIITGIRKKRSIFFSRRFSASRWTLPARKSFRL